LSEIARLAETHTDQQIAELLNQQGRHTGTRQAFTRQLVGRLRRDKDIPGYLEHLRKAGLWTSQEVCAQTGMAEQTLKKRREAGMIKGVRCDQHQWLYEPPVECLRSTRAPNVGGAVV
jgi:hypothetical protein